MHTLTIARHTEIAALPAYGIAGEVNRVLAERGCVIVTAPPGAGKSTVLPLTIAEAFPQGKVILLEPRRVAARQVASRMAWLLGEQVGETVGYRIRLESRISSKTRVEVVTEGILTRMLLDDPALERVGTVIFDEFHERSLTSDEALALTRQCRSLLREDLRIVIMSATIDTDVLSRTLDAPVVESEGKMFPVEIVHAKEEADAFGCAALVAKTVLQAHRSHAGDILAFLPGEGEIRKAEELLTGQLGNTAVYPLYGLLSSEDQARAIAPSRPGERKVVLATPIAETSLTIEGVRVVVDSGLCRKMVFDPRSGLSHLETVRISLDMATQRTGRAGRVAPGICYRLWSTGTQARMAPIRTPEILEADLAPLVLDSAVWGEKDVESLPWLTAPPRPALVHARELLLSLGAIDTEDGITARGKALSKLPCHPRIAAMLLSARTGPERALAADLAALLEEKDTLAGEGDVSVDRRLDALRRGRNTRLWSRIARVARQYADLVHAPVDDSPVNPYDAGRLLAQAYPERIGKAWKEGVGTFQLAGGELVAVEPRDPLAGADWVVAASMHPSAGGVGKVFLASVVAPEDLAAFTKERDVVFWDAKGGAAVARRECRIGAILLWSRPLSGEVKEKLQVVICEAIARNGTSLLSFDDAAGNLQRRIGFVALRHPELELPAVDTAALCAAAREWGPLFVGGATTLAELKKIDLCEVIWSRLSYNQQQAVERLAPTHITVPTGSQIRLEYRQGAEAPVLRVRLQECFGLVDTPRVDGAPVLMELLSPGYKPVQLTKDLRSFWSGTYFEVRKELRRRYPKHAWPEDPLEAAPVRGIKKKC